jgi:hypothetical protein
MYEPSWQYPNAGSAGFSASIDRRSARFRAGLMTKKLSPTISLPWRANMVGMAIAGLQLCCVTRDGW